MLVGVLYLVVFWGFAFPLNMGLLDEVDIPDLNSFALILAVATGGFLVVFCYRACVWPLMLFSAIYTLYYSFAVSQTPAQGLRKASEDFYELSSQTNISLITLDSLQSNDAAHLFEETPELQKDFSGFHFFSNAAGTAPWTNLSSLFTKGGVILKDVTISEYVAKTEK